VSLSAALAFLAYASPGAAASGDPIGPLAEQSPPAEKAESAGSEIVVVAERLRATIIGAIEAEQSLDASALSGMGASNLAEILSQLSAQTGGSQGRAGGGSIVLVNGKRIGSLDEVKTLPPEAIQRVDILPEEAALRLGYPANSKPVNVVLKPNYKAVSGELEDRVTTRGLRNDFNTEVNVVDIAGDNRITANLQYQIGDAITEAKRGVIRPVDANAASDGGLVTNPLGGAILPASPLVLGVPAAISGSVTAFLAAPAIDTTGSFHTLIPSTRQFTADGTLARALGNGKALTVSGKFDNLIADDMLGPAIADLQIPVEVSSPFAVPLHLRRSLPDQPAVMRRTKTNTTHLGAMLAGFGRWQWSASVNFDGVDQSRRRQGGVDALPFQAAINAGGLIDPFAAPAPGLLQPCSESTSNSHDRLYAADLFASGDLIPFRSGSINLSLRATAARESIDTAQSAQSSALVRNHVGGQASLDVPLLSKSSAVGALDAGLNAGGDSYSDAGSISSWGATLNWKPTRHLSLLLATSKDQMVPGLSQLGAPTEVTPDAAFYDYGTARSLLISRIDGGNLALAGDSRKIFKAELGWRPISGLNLTTTYTSLYDRNAQFAFPGITPEAEAALPLRFLRNATGALLSVDTRPFDAALERRQELKLGLTFNKNFKSGNERKIPGGGAFGGGHAFGAQGKMIQFSLTDTVRLQDKVELVPGAATIDLISGNVLGDTLRVPRHRIEAQLSGAYHGFGLRSNIVWTSGGVAGAGHSGQLDFADRLAFNVRLFYFPASNPAVAAAAPWLNGVRFLFVVDNIFDSYQRVADRVGVTPLAYQRGLIDPIGRTFRFSIRKTVD
jgi:hypothetical protein